MRESIAKLNLFFVLAFALAFPAFSFANQINEIDNLRQQVQDLAATVDDQNYIVQKGFRFLAGSAFFKSLAFDRERFFVELTNLPSFQIKIQRLFEEIEKIEPGSSANLLKLMVVDLTFQNYQKLAGRQTRICQDELWRKEKTRLKK